MREGTPLGFPVIFMQHRFALPFQIASIAILVFGCFLVLKPFLTAMLLAAVVCVSTWPVYHFVRKRCGGHAPLAALVTSLLMVLVLVLPLALIAGSLANNAPLIGDAARKLFADGAPLPPAWLAGIPLVGEPTDSYWRELAASHEALIDALAKLFEPARAYLVGALILLGDGVIQMSLSAFIAFFFYRDGEYLVHKMLFGLNRIAGPAADEVMHIVANTTTSVVYGLIGTALAQAAASVVGFWLAHVPGALLLGAATFILSLAPMGPPLVWGSAAIWLFYQGEVGWGIFLIVWGLLVVSSIDSFLKPWLISRGSSMPFVLVLLGVLGGVLAFGFVGLFLGPVLLAVGLNLARKWTSETTAPGESVPLD
jgi:predicted PurR-regulated permease PerM